MKNPAGPPRPEVISIYFAHYRDGFKYPVEQYRHWIVLGLQEGRFRYSFDCRNGAICEPGEFLICPPGVNLHRKAFGRIGFYFIRFNWPVDLAAAWQGKYSPGDVNRMASTLGHLQKLNDIPTKDESAWANHLLEDLILLSAFEKRRTEQAAPKVPDRLMIQTAEKLRQNLTEPFHLEDLAAKIRLTPSQFSRRFKAAFGANPASFRTQARMREARRLLVETAKSLDEIAQLCGYENAFYFSRVFTAQNGRAPSLYRKNSRV